MLQLEGSQLCKERTLRRLSRALDRSVSGAENGADQIKNGVSGNGSGERSGQLVSVNASVSETFNTLIAAQNVKVKLRGRFLIRLRQNVLDLMLSINV